jgi:hypothetical protein
MRCCRLGGFNAASPASLVLADLRVGSGGGAGGVGTVDGGCGMPVRIVDSRCNLQINGAVRRVGTAVVCRLSH